MNETSASRRGTTSNFSQSLKAWLPLHRTLLRLPSMLWVGVVGSLLHRGASALSVPWSALLGLWLILALPGGQALFVLRTRVSRIRGCPEWTPTWLQIRHILFSHGCVPPQVAHAPHSPLRASLDGRAPSITIVLFRLMCMTSRRGWSLRSLIAVLPVIGKS